MTSAKSPRSSEHERSNEPDGEPKEGAADKETGRMQPVLRRAGSETNENTGLDAGLQSLIGHQLKAMFDEVAKAPVPDKFLELLSRLDGQEKGK